ncbi:MAG: hypothetical protein WC224_01560 [Sphaerochaetaceae bacterium]
MKKTLAFVLVLASVFALSAAVNFSGGFEWDITIPVDGSPISTKGYDDNEGTSGGMSLNVTGDFYKLTFNSTFSDYNVLATGDLYIDKALADVGVDLPISLTLTAGNSRVTAQNVYQDPNSNYAGRIRIDNLNNLPISATIGYNDIITLLVGYSFNDTPDSGLLADQVQNYLVSAKIAPINGISATVGWTNHDQWSEYKNYTATQQSVLAVTGKIELDKLINNLPIDLAISGAASIFDFEALDTTFGAAAISVGIDDASADFEYQYDQGTHGIGANIGYEGFKNVGLYAGLGSSDVTDFSDTLWYYVKASYNLAGTTYYTSFSESGIGVGMDFSF